MQLTVSVQLQADCEQFQGLKKTLETANAACNEISRFAFSEGIFQKYALQNKTYASVREQFGLGAQLAVRCIGKVADAYKLDRKVPRTFAPHGAIPYDARILTWNVAEQWVTINTVAGRFKVPFLCGQHQARLLQQGARGEADLVLREGSFYLLVAVSVPAESPIAPTGVLGCDFGIVNLATDSLGSSYSGEQVLKTRRRYRRMRQQLQPKRTRSARKKLQRIRRKERNFSRNTNHCISKALVQTATSQSKALAVERLTGIRSRGNRFRLPQRTELNSWAFFQLRVFTAYKAERAGVPILEVDPAYTSQTCSRCGHREKANRTSQDQFKCRHCGFETHADYNAAVNIEARAMCQLAYCSEQQLITAA